MFFKQHSITVILECNIMEDLTKKLIGTRINTALAAANLKQKDLAKELDVTDNTVSYWCNGTRTPNTDQIIQIARVLNISSDYLLGLSDVAITDINIKAICEYTGLSSEAVNKIHRTKEEDADIMLLDRILKDEGFYILIDTMQQIIDKYDESIYIGSVVLDTLKSIPNIKDIFTDYCEGINLRGKWFNNAIGEENYKKIEDAIGSETIPYLRNYVARKSNRHSQKRAKEMEEYFDDESIVDIALMRIDELRYDIKIDQFFVSKNADDLLNDIIEDEGLEVERDKMHSMICDYFRGDAGDSECPQ